MGIRQSLGGFKSKGNTCYPASGGIAISQFFANEARLAFDTLCRRFEMLCVLASECTVRYENENIFLTINFDFQRSFELGVEIGRRRSASLERPFSLGEVLRLNCPEEAAPIDGMMVREATHLPGALERLAQLTSIHAVKFLQGSDLSFAQLARLRQMEGEAYALEKMLRAVRARSDAAWEKRDYQSVVSSLGSIEQHLSPAEKKRLQYSRHHLAP